MVIIVILFASTWYGDEVGFENITRLELFPARGVNEE